jgi:hypothetical protein
MNAVATGSAPPHETQNGMWDLYKGWIVGFFIIFVVLAVGTGLWLHFHS